MFAPFGSRFVMGSVQREVRLDCAPQPTERFPGREASRQEAPGKGPEDVEISGKNRAVEVSPKSVGREIRWTAPKKPMGETHVFGYLQGNRIIPRFRWWCKISSIRSCFEDGWLVFLGVGAPFVVVLNHPPKWVNDSVYPPKKKKNDISGLPSKDG